MFKKLDFFVFPEFLSDCTKIETELYRGAISCRGIGQSGRVLEHGFKPILQSLLLSHIHLDNVPSCSPY